MKCPDLVIVIIAVDERNTRDHTLMMTIKERHRRNANGHSLGTTTKDLRNRNANDLSLGMMTSENDLSLVRDLDAVTTIKQTDVLCILMA